MKVILIIAQLICLQTLVVWAACPLEDDPTNLIRCIQIDISSIIAAARGDTDLTAFCSLASRYLECFKTYTRGCVGYFLADGGFTEIQLIAQYCCNGITSSVDCPFNPNVKRTCIDQDANVTMFDGSHKTVKSLEIGDKVTTLDQDGKLTNTDVIMMMDVNDQETLFLNITTNTNKNIRVSGTHLVSIPGNQFKFAKELYRGDSIITLDTHTGYQTEETIKSILIEPVKGYAAPLTMSGTMLVDNILLSNYAIIKSHSLAHTAMAPVRWWYSVNNEIKEVVPDSLSSTIMIEKQMNGTHWFPGMLHSFNSYANVVKLH